MTKIIKSRFISSVFAILLAMAMMLSSASAFAVDDSSLVEREELVESVTRGPNVPTEEGALPYHASFSNVQNGIYSGKYFSGTTEFTVEIWGTDPSGTRFNIYIFEVVNGGAYPVRVASNAWFAEFTGLSSSKNYAIFIKPIGGGPVSGNIDIYGKVL